MRRSMRKTAKILLAALMLAACDEPQARVDEAPTPTTTPTAPGEEVRVDSRPPPLARPVDLWENGRTVSQIDAATAAEHGYVLLDLGEAWTPYLFTEQANESEPRVPSTYRATFLALARGEYPEDHHGERARKDKYLELFGIPPTLGLLRERFRRAAGLECAATLDPTPIAALTDMVAYRHDVRARDDVRRFRVIENNLERLLTSKHAADLASLDRSTLNERERRVVADYERLSPAVRAVEATQRRLACEGYFDPEPGEARPPRYIEGAYDWQTNEAIAEFERRHRIFGWGYLISETRAALAMPPVETERRDVVRVLTERAIHAAGIIEDGSAVDDEGHPLTYRGRDGATHEVPNLVSALETAVTEAFGLQTPEATLAWLNGLGELPPNASRIVAIRRPALPEYYASDMPLSVIVDRGDVWYEFPYDELGHERDQPIARRPRLTIFTEYEGQRIALARYGTTVGGWRSESIGGVEVWKFKNSPVGPRLWHQIVAAPVWLPPESTPARELLKRGRDGRMHVNLHETGPSYASAYGLVAAYHATFRENADGEFEVGGDEGIRTHGSVNYMSIMRRHSHGCHRLHNHIAVRLMSFVLAHRRHTRVGEHPVAYSRVLEHEGETYTLELDQGGYVYTLEQPIHIEVLEGRIRGSRSTPIEFPLPKFDETVQAYVLDGGAVTVSRTGVLTPTTFPILDGGIDGSLLGMDAGVPLPVTTPTLSNGTSVPLAPVAPAPTTP